MKGRAIGVVSMVLVTCLLIWIIDRAGAPHRFTRDEINRSIRQQKKELKAKLAAEGRQYEPDLIPNEWAAVQRAYPYERINFGQLRDAILDAQAMRIEAKHRQGVLSGTWVGEGPTNIGARVTDLAIHPTNPDVVYAAHASSGVFKTTNGGTSWFPITDDLPVITIGAIAIDPQNPDVIYVGTGEANGNSRSFFGMGVFKSSDGGATWSYTGLEETRYVGRVVVDPLNSQRVWVAGTGALYGTNPERGVYRSTNGGTSWELVLNLSDSTAAIDIAVDPIRPDTVFAAMWERVRGLTYKRLGGPTSGIFRSYDGGDTWTRLTAGLPTGSVVGRIGISVCASNPSVVYAIFADNVGELLGIYKSVNGGSSWARTNDVDLRTMYRSWGWYFGQIRVDPSDPDRVFAMGVPFYRSEDGGASWVKVGQDNHIDHHAMAFDPSDPARIFEGNDGGIYVSSDHGSTWVKLYDQPTNQFYAIEIDYQCPERLYGGTQDCGTLRTPTGGTDDWEEIFWGDGFYCIVDPTDPNIIYCTYQYGALRKSTDFGETWVKATEGIVGGDRRNWMAPVVMDPSDHLKLYYGSYRVYRTRDGAGSWLPISGDLTGGAQGANFGTLTTIALTPADSNVIYAGTDDANVWVTLDGGGSWTDVSGSLPNRWVTRIAVDPHSAAVAYVAFSGLRWDENIGYVYRTEDYGASWTDITGNLPGAPVNVIVIDPAEPARIFVGTDLGCLYTEDLGVTWKMLGTELPAVPVYDLKIHNPTRALVAGTHGRSMYSFDLATLPGLAATEPGQLRPAVRLSVSPNPFMASTTVTFSLSVASEVSLDVYDLAGRRVRALTRGQLSAGTHRVSWDGASDSGDHAASGVYFVRLRTEEGVATGRLNLVR